MDVEAAQRFVQTAFENDRDAAKQDLLRVHTGNPGADTSIDAWLNAIRYYAGIEARKAAS